MIRGFLACGFAAAWLLYGSWAGLLPTRDCPDEVRGGIFGSCTGARVTCAPVFNANPCDIRNLAEVCLCPAGNSGGCNGGGTHPTCVWACTLSSCGANTCPGRTVGINCGNWLGHNSCSRTSCGTGVVGAFPCAAGRQEC